MFSQSEKDISDTSQNGHSNEDVLLESTNENVIELIEHIDESSLLDYLDRITSFGPHPTRSRAIRNLGNYIYDEFESMGLIVRYQSWRERVPILKYPLVWFGWYKGTNIEATLPGTDETSDKIFVISAHYDSWLLSPGADDDGSGVAAILSIAKVMSQYSFNHTIRFVIGMVN